MGALSGRSSRSRESGLVLRLCAAVRLAALVVIVAAGSGLFWPGVSGADGFPSGLTVFVGYADNLRASGFFPSPWQGDPGVIFKGCTGGCSFDAGAVMVENTSSVPVTVNSLQVRLSTCTINIWPLFVSLPAQQKLIYTQTVSGADNGCPGDRGTFDTSDIGPNGVGWAGHCDQSGVTPEIDLTVNGVTQTFTDSAHVLNTGGVDLADCPVGMNESQPWTQLNPSLTPPEGIGRNPAEPQLPLCKKGQPVDCATGNFWHTLNELYIPARGVPLQLQLTYNSLTASQDSPIGFGWSFTYGMHLVIDQATGDVTVVQENGSTVPFTNLGGSLQAPSYAAATLVHNGDGSYTFVRKHGATTFRFSSSGALQSISDRNGYTTTFAYNGSGQLTSVTDASDPPARSLTFSYGPNGRISQVTDPDDRTVGLGYNDAGELTSVTDTNNGVTRFTYQASTHRMLTLTKPRNVGSWTNTYDPATGQVTSQTDPLNRTTTFSYLASTTTITDPKGNITREHFSNLLPVAVTRGYGTTAEATWTYTYDPDSLGVATATDPNNHTSTTLYDADNNVRSFTDAGNRTTTATYNSFEEPLLATDPSQVATTYTYDNNGNLRTVSRPLVDTGATQTVTLNYDDAAHPGDVTSIQDARNKTTQFAYDTYGDVRSVTDPLGDKTTSVHNALSQVTSTVSPRGNVTGCNCASAYTTSYQYNGLGLLTHVTNPLNHTTSEGYDADGNLLYSTDGDEKRTDYTYDPADELTKITRADTTTLQYGYDPDGNRNSQTNGANKTTSYTYDQLNRLASVTDPLTRTTSVGYDGAGNRTSVTDPSNRTTTFGYDEANELTSIQYSDGTTPAVSFTYTPNGLRKTMTDGTGTTNYVYDSLNRLTSQTNGARKTVSYGYDLDNHLTSLTYPNNQTVTRTYDDAGRLTSITDWLNHTTSLTPDADGNTVNTAYPNGVAATGSLNHADELTSITETSPGGSTLASFTYTRDGNGQLTSTSPTGTGQGSNENYGYNALNQLTSVNTPTVFFNAYLYNAADDITRLASGATLGYDNANEMTSYATLGRPATTFAYDHQGNRLNDLTGAPASYGYDQANRLTSANSPKPVSAVAAGYNHSLAVLKSDGTVWAWGDNYGGDLGNGTTTNSSVPVQVQSLTGVTTVAAGENLSLGRKSDGTVWAWGVNTYGQLGNGTTTNSSVPVQVKNLASVTAIDAGHAHGVARRSDGTVWSWGWNYYGQLGNGSTTNSKTPVQVKNLTGVTAIAAGDYHSLAVKSDGTVWAWGSNSYGQLGNGTITNSKTPVQVKNLAGVTAVAAGSFHSFALKSDGTVWAWGRNDRGELGNGTTTNSSVPVKVSNLTDVTSLARGSEGDHSLAVKSDGSAWAWGDNYTGQLGDWSTADRSVPVQVMTLTSVTAVARGSFHSLAATSDGSAWGFGQNYYGQLGNGTTTDSDVPVHVSGLSQKTSYTYDGDGVRASKTIAGSTLQFAWDFSSDLPLLLTDGNTNYIYDDNRMPVEQVDNAGTPLYYQHDQLGSTRLLTTNTGVVAATFSYDAYGNLTLKTGSSDTALRWNGEYQDTDTGLYYLRARYYDPQTAQFITRDPLAPITQQPYGYVGGNPLNATDPTGLVTLGYCVGGSGAISLPFSPIGVGGGATGCLTRVVEGGPDQIGVTVTYGGGAALGAGVGAGYYIAVSNATDLKGDLGGRFLFAEYTGAFFGVRASVVVFTNFSFNIWGVEIGVGVGAGITGRAGVTNTNVWEFGGFTAWSAKLEWDLLNPAGGLIVSTGQLLDWAFEHLYLTWNVPCEDLK
jgi:RHS repeat-associated protein